MNYPALAILGSTLTIGIGLLLYFTTERFAWVGLLLVFAGMFFYTVSLTYSVSVGEKAECLRVTPAISQQKTKWLDGRCYIADREGNYIPFQMTQHGYN